MAQRDVRQRIAASYIADEGIRLTQMRALSALAKGQVPGPEQSISKVVVAKTMQEMAAFALDLSEARGFVTAGADADLAKLQGSYMAAAGLRIAGGTTRYCATSSPSGCWPAGRPAAGQGFAVQCGGRVSQGQFIAQSLDVAGPSAMLRCDNDGG